MNYLLHLPITKYSFKPIIKNITHPGKRSTRVAKKQGGGGFIDEKLYRGNSITALLKIYSPSPLLRIHKYCSLSISASSRQISFGALLASCRAALQRGEADISDLSLSSRRDATPITDL